MARKEPNQKVKKRTTKRSKELFCKKLLAHSYGRLGCCKDFNGLRRFMHAFHHVFPKHDASVPSGVVAERTFEDCLFQAYHLVQDYRLVRPIMVCDCM
jgi:hypothetical protein